MLSRRFLFLFLVSIMSINLSIADNGGGEGNGGGAIVCRENNDPKGKIVSATLLDVWEARALGLDDKKVIDIDMKLQEIELYLKENIQKLYIDYTTSFPHIERQILGILQSKDDVIIEKIPDAKFREFPRTCSEFGREDLVPSYEMVVNYLSQSRLSVDRTIYASFSDVSKLGIFVHETIYKIFRENFLDTNSGNARYVTGLLLSYVTGAISKNTLNRKIHLFFNFELPSRNTASERNYTYFSIDDAVLTEFAKAASIYWDAILHGDIGTEEVMTNFKEILLAPKIYLGIDLRSQPLNFALNLCFVMGYKTCLAYPALDREFLQNDTFGLDGNLLGWNSRTDVLLARKYLALLLRETPFDYDFFSWSFYVNRVVGRYLLDVNVLMIAANMGDVESVKWILENRPIDPKAKTFKGKNALYYLNSSKFATAEEKKVISSLLIAAQEQKN